MTKTGFFQKILFLAAALGLAATVQILWMRVQYERANNTVEIVVDMKSLRAAAPVSISDKYIVKRLNKIGVASTGVYEYKAEEMMVNGEMRVARERRRGITGKAGLQIKIPDRFISRTATPVINAYFGDGACATGSVCTIPVVDKQHLEDISFGLDGDRPGDRIIPRFFNTPFENENSIKLKLSALAELPEPALVIFDGESVLGYPDLIDKTARLIDEAPGWSFGFVELVPQDGSRRMAKNLPGKVLPVHSIAELELAELTPEKAVSRYRRAVRERGVRVLYVRPYPSLYGKSPEDALIANMKYIEDLVLSLKEDGYTIGKAQPLAPFEMEYDYPARRVVRGLCVAGAVALAGLIAGAVTGLPAWLSLSAAAACFLGVMFLPAPLVRLLIKLTALGTACSVPALSVAMFYLPRKPGDTLLPSGAGRSLALLASACAVTIAAGASTAAMLSERSYFLRLDVFTGVKLAFLLPIVLLFFLYLEKTGHRLKDFLDSPVKYVEFGAGLLLLGVMAVYMLRSGNEGPSQVGGFDSFFREYLETIFSVRPRTKEFIIGYPALLLAGLFPATRSKYFPFILLMLGTVGQVSVFNTFCHLHTPLTVTWVRLALGLALGAACGLALRACVSLAIGKKS